MAMSIEAGIIYLKQKSLLRFIFWQMQPRICLGKEKPAQTRMTFRTV